MNILLIGSGGREHALAWKIAQSPRCGKLYILPGNPGTAACGENVAIKADEIEEFARFAEEKKIDLTIVGPDDPLALGVVDAFAARGLRIFGPTKAAARIESSKAFAKELMLEAGIPTAEARTFRSHEEALAYVRDRGAPIVVKASGLALGKGVYVCTTIEEAGHALSEVMLDHRFGEAGDEVVVEEYLEGVEFSVHVLCDGTDFLLLPPSQDHKRAQEGDQGPNTGGMGTVAPVPGISDETMREIGERIVRPTLAALRQRGTPFTGLLYPGIMLTKDGPKVIEFNARWGDPETQVYMRLLESDILDLFEACIDGRIAQQKVQWRAGFAANIVLASGGYPGEYKKGFSITGIEEAEKVEGVVVFHAGTKAMPPLPFGERAGVRGGQFITSGGRVFGVSAVAPTLKEALARAYWAADKIRFEGKYVRSDIGTRCGILLA